MSIIRGIYLRPTSFVIWLLDYFFKAKRHLRFSRLLLCEEKRVSQMLDQPKLYSELVIAKLQGRDLSSCDLSDIENL